VPVSVVFGASGAIGRFLVPRLLDAGHDVIALSRAVRTSSQPRLRWIAGDLYGDVPALPTADAIFSLGPLDGFARWLKRSDIGGARIVAMSSLSAETKQDSTDPAERALADRLRAAEEALHEAGSATVLRSTLIYGAGLDRSLAPIARLAMRWRVFPFIAGIGALRQPVHAADLADACLAVSNTQAPRPMYRVGGGERLGFSAMFARVRASLPHATLPLPIPYRLARAGAGIAQRLPAFRSLSVAALDRLDRDLIADHADAAQDFGFSPRVFRPEPRDWTPPPLP